MFTCPWLGHAQSHPARILHTPIPVPAWSIAYGVFQLAFCNGRIYPHRSNTVIQVTTSQSSGRNRSTKLCFFRGKLLQIATLRRDYTHVHAGCAAEHSDRYKWYPFRCSHSLSLIKDEPETVHMLLLGLNLGHSYGNCSLSFCRKDMGNDIVFWFGMISLNIGKNCFVCFVDIVMGVYVCNDFGNYQFICITANVSFFNIIYKVCRLILVSQF